MLENLFLITIILAITATIGLGIAIERFVITEAEYIHIAFNKVHSKKTTTGYFVRIILGGGITPLLHGEQLTGEKLSEEPNTIPLVIPDAETNDDSRVIAEMVYTAKVNPNRIQEASEFTQKTEAGTQDVRDQFDSLVESWGQDVVAEHSSEDVFTDKIALNRKLGTKPSGKNYFFKEELDCGFQIVSMRFKNFRNPPAVEAGKERVAKVDSFSDAAEKLAKRTYANFDGFDPDKKAQIIKDSLRIILQDDGKVEEEILTINLNGGDGLSQEARDRLFAEVSGRRTGS
jgi:hypothetical protein